jgi:hypothetical protein
MQSRPVRLSTTPTTTVCGSTIKYRQAIRGRECKHCTAPYRTLPYCTKLYRAVLYVPYILYIPYVPYVLYHTVPYCTVSYRTISYRTVPNEIWLWVTDLPLRPAPPPPPLTLIHNVDKYIFFNPSLLPLDSAVLTLQCLYHCTLCFAGSNQTFSRLLQSILPRTMELLRLSNIIFLSNAFLN